jgi:oxepin-CoA hydrolase/3-oxo-5,6-dehydrosuberyl-CoA semialdehyde dehydrogenase
VSQALIARLEKVVVGDPAGRVKMGALVNTNSAQTCRRKWITDCRRLPDPSGGKADLQAAGAFFPPTLLFCPQPDETRRSTPPRLSARLRR